MLVMFSVIYTVSVGKNYTLHTGTAVSESSIPEANVTFENDGIVKLDRLRIENGELAADISSLEKGKTKVTMSFEDQNGNKVKQVYDLKVNNMGTVFDRTGGKIVFSGFRVIVHAVIGELFLYLVFMLWMYFDYRKKGDFSYQMVACGGISIYIAILLSYVIYYVLNNEMDSFSFFLSLVSRAGMVMLVLLTPLMFLLSILLAVSNIWLMRNEGYRPMNALGIVFAVIWFIGTMLTVGMYFMPVVVTNRPIRIINLHLIYLAVYMECMFISTVACSFLATKFRPPFDRDFIIILGCAIRKDGTPTPLLKGRADSALAFEKEQYEKTGKHAVFVPSGGQGSDEVISEGESMENYLIGEGIPKERIAREDKSVNTYQNMKFSKKVIDGFSDVQDKKVAFATTNYHVFRGYILSKKNGFDAKGISAKTKEYFFPNAFLREFIGLMVDQKWKHIIFIVLVLLGFLQIGLIAGT